MSNILFKMFHEVSIQNLKVAKETLEKNQQLKEIQFTRSSMKLGERNFTQSQNNEYEYSYKNNIDPYNLKNYFTIPRKNSITIFTGDDTGKFKTSMPKKYNGKDLSDDFKYLDKDGKKIKFKLNNKTYTSNDVFKLDLEYIKYREENQAKLQSETDARKLISVEIAKRLGKTGVANIENPDSGVYQPSRAEMIALIHMLKSEIGAKNGGDFNRTERMWQREKAAILWCYINAVYNGFSTTGNSVTTSILQLIPSRDSTLFQGYISEVDNLYKDMNLEDNQIASGKSNDKFNNDYNYELFIDAFFQGYFPEEVKGYTNWSHHKRLPHYNPTHLPKNYSFDNKVNISCRYQEGNNELNENINVKSIPRSLESALTLDGNIIITKGAGAKNGSFAGDNKD